MPVVKRRYSLPRKKIKQVKPKPHVEVHDYTELLETLEHRGAERDLILLDGSVKPWLTFSIMEVSKLLQKHRCSVLNDIKFGRIPYPLFYARDVSSCRFDRVYLLEEVQCILSYLHVRSRQLNQGKISRYRLLLGLRYKLMKVRCLLNEKIGKYLESYYQELGIEQDICDL